MHRPARINREPIIVGNPHGSYATIGEDFSYDFEIYDLDGPAADIVCTVSVHHTSDDLWTPTNDPQFDGTHFTWTPTAEDMTEDGDWNFTITAKDNPAGGIGLAPAESTLSFTLRVTDNEAPFIISTAMLHPVPGEHLFHRIVAVDPEQGPLRYEMNGNIPEGLYLSPSTGRFWWLDVPSNAQDIIDGMTTDPVVITVTDAFGVTASQTLQFECERNRRYCAYHRLIHT